MCAKKKATLNRTWKLAGEPLASAPLSAEEKGRISREFSDYDGYIRHTLASGGGCVPLSEAKTNESAAIAVSAYFCEHFAGQYERGAVVTAVATTAAVPANLSARLGRMPAFLMGAALWLLDHLEETCDEADDYLSLLPPEPDIILEYTMPFADDLGHSRELILRMLTVLDGREGAYRKNFRAILDLIEADTAARLRGMFKDALTDYMDRALRVCQLLGIAPWNPPHPLDFSSSFGLLDELQALQDDEHPSFHFLLMAPELICRPVSAVREELHSRKAAELISGYSVSDPYALCTAYLILEREKDMLASLNGLTAVVMICATRHLPWAQDDLGARTSLVERGSPDYRLQYVYGEQPGEEKRLELEWLLSEAQLFYIATGGGSAPKSKTVQ